MPKPSFKLDSMSQDIPFKEGLRSAYSLLYNDDWDENLQEYAVALLYRIREERPLEWNSSWKNDAFLGMACNITLKYDERYSAYKSAYEKANPPPPGIPLLTQDQAIELLKTAIQDVPYVDALGLLRKIYWEKGDHVQERYWGKVLQDAEENGVISTPSIEPDFLSQERLNDD